MPTVRLEREGLFGPVGVVDTAWARRFSINGVLQGASLLAPAAGDIAAGLPAGPGPVIETRYQLAWLLAGQRHPAGRGLMIGLGGGGGAVGLLHQFPQLRLDAVEIDPRVVEMAREFHPLVGYYEQAGRLAVSTADGEDFLAGAVPRYDFAIADIVVDGEDADILKSLALIEPLTGAAGEVWLHAFGSIWQARLHEVLQKFDAAGRPVAWLFSPVADRHSAAGAAQLGCHRRGDGASRPARLRAVRRVARPAGAGGSRRICNAGRACAQPRRGRAVPAGLRRRGTRVSAGFRRVECMRAGDVGILDLGYLHPDAHAAPFPMFDRQVEVVLEQHR